MLVFHSIWHQVNFGKTSLFINCYLHMHIFMSFCFFPTVRHLLKHQINWQVKLRFLKASQRKKVKNKPFAHLIDLKNKFENGYELQTKLAWWIFTRSDIKQEDATKPCLKIFKKFKCFLFFELSHVHMAKKLSDTAIICYLLLPWDAFWQKLLQDKRRCIET